MDIAIVTGANTRIGLAISRKLIDTGCRVYGMGSDFSDFPLEHGDFIPVTCDLTNTEHLCQVVQEIIDKEKNIYVLVNHARYLNLQPYEQQGLNDLESMVHTNLLAPLILTRLALPSLIRLRGYVLNIGFPDLPGSHRLGSAFLSTEVALQNFSDRLYEEVRQDKVKVCSLILDSANAESMFKEGFTERDNHDLIVCSEATAQAVEYVISQKRESVVSRLVVRPQKREPDASDREEARKLSAPQPYSARKSAKKVVIGRLKKAEVVESEEKAPATYMDMVREIAEEEAQNPKLMEESQEPPVKNRRRRRRGRRYPNKEENKTVENSPQAKAPEKPDRPPQPKRSRRQRPSRAKPAGDPGKPKMDTPSRENLSEQHTTPRVPKKKVPAKKVDTGKTPAKKTVARKTPAKKVATKKVTARKVPAKKTTRKHVARKVARKRSSSKD